MTAYATRAPLQLIQNPHMMSEVSRGHGRRTSARLADKEDAPLTNGISHENEPVKKSAGGKQGKNAVNAYDEEEDGFAFTRTRAKKAKAAPTLAPTTEEEKPEERTESVSVKRSRKKSVGSPPAPQALPAENEIRVGKRRSTRHSGEHENADPPPLQVKKRKKDRTSSDAKQDQAPERYPKNPQQPEQEPQHNQSHSYETTFDATKIALPFADTPAKIQDLEQQIARLKAERETWESLLRPPLDKTPMLPPLPPTPSDPSTINASLLSDPIQVTALQTLQSLATDFQPSLSAATSHRLQTINQNLDFEIDKFATNVHALGAYKDAAERVADDILSTGAEALENRDREGKKRANGEAGEVGTRDVLKALSRIIDR
ncbi:kinetochore protein Mis13/DSN1, partial [Lecanoromycetidae sp. Uapishka_2]